MNTTDAMDRLASADPFPDGLPTPPFEPVLRRLDEQEPSATFSACRERFLEPPLGAWLGPAGDVIACSRCRLGGRGASRAPRRPVAARRRPCAVAVAAVAVWDLAPAPNSPRQSTAADCQEHVGRGAAAPRSAPQPDQGSRRVSEPRRGAGSVRRDRARRPSRTSARDLVDDGDVSSRWSGRCRRQPVYPGRAVPLGVGYASELVPDAVRRVKWVFGGRTVYPAIRDNVAVAPASVPRGTGPGLKSVTWYDAGGRVVAYEDAATFQKRQAASEQRSIDREINPVLRRRFPVLNRPHTTADRLPSALQTITRRDRSLAPWLSQRVDIPGSRLVDWIVPGRDGFCRFDAERLPGGRTVTPALSEHCVSGIKPDHKGDRTHHQRRGARPGSEPKQRTNAGDRVLLHNRHVGHGRPLRRPQCPSPDYRRHDRRPCFPWRPDLSPHPRPTTPRTKDPNANALKPRAWNSPPVLDVYPSRVVPSTLLEAELQALLANSGCSAGQLP